MKTQLKVAVTLVACLCCLAQEMSAQQQPRTSIQLPVFSFFRAVTTINIPDRGEALLGSVKRYSSGSVSRGVPLLGNLPVIGRPFKNRAMGQSRSAATLSAGVQIYDLHEMDRALLEEARRDRVLRLGGPTAVKGLVEKETIRQKAAFITRNLGRSGNEKR